MKNKLWISTSIAALLLGGVASPNVYADSQDDSNPSTIQENTTNPEEQTTTVNSSTVESSLPSSSEQIQGDNNDAKDGATEDSTSEESTTTSQVAEIAAMEEVVEESTTSQGTWGTASYEFDASTGTLTVNSGTISSNITGIDKKLVKHIILENNVSAPQYLAGVFAQFKNLITESGDLNTSKSIDMSGAFKDLYNLVSVDVSDWDFTSPYDIGGFFQDCHSLTNADVSNWDVSKVKGFNSVFYKCYNLTNVDVSNWDTSSATSFNTLFYECHSLTNIDVSNWNASKVSDMIATFNGCNSLTTVDVSNWDTSNVTNMKILFQNCNNLTNLDVSNWDTSNVTDMSWLFYNCGSLTNLDVSNWDTFNVTLMKAMFNKCSNLESIDVSNWDTSNVTDMSYMFYNTTNLSKIGVGTNSKFNSGVTLPKINSQDGTYTGRWIAIDTESIYDSSDNFMDNYDGTKPGTYIWESSAVYSLNVKDIKIYVGENWSPSDNYISGSYYLSLDANKIEHVVDFTDSLISVVGNAKVDTGTPGAYHVTYKLGNVEKQATVTVLENKQSITGSDFTMTVGDSTPTASSFKAFATDKGGNNLEVTADLSKADVTKAGIYDVTLTTTDGQSKTVKLTVKDKVIADNEVTTPGTGDKGNNSGTSTSVVNSSNSTVKTPARGNYSSSSLPKTGVESSISLIAIGLGLVLISLLTLGFVRKRNK